MATVRANTVLLQAAILARIHTVPEMSLAAFLKKIVGRLRLLIKIALQHLHCVHHTCWETTHAQRSHNPPDDQCHSVSKKQTSLFQVGQAVKSWYMAGFG